MEELIFPLLFFVHMCMFYFRPCSAACGILVPWPEIETMLLELRAQSLNHWTSREVAYIPFIVAIHFEHI